jgi:hypothetical protein
VNVLAETEVVSPSLPSPYTLLTQREPGTQVKITPRVGFPNDLHQRVLIKSPIHKIGGGKKFSRRRNSRKPYSCCAMYECVSI